jgi:hypothetical protein
MPTPLQLDRATLRALDLAVLKQVCIDLGLARGGRRGCVGDEMLEAARWLFANPRRDHPFHLDRICERLEIDPLKLVVRVFRLLSEKQRIAIRLGLRHYRKSLLPVLTQLNRPAEAIREV